MSKKSIIKRAVEAQESPAKAHSPATRAQGALDAVDAAKIASEVADALWARLERFLPICARLAAADTLHTSEKPQTVFKRAIAEGLAAADLIGKEMRHAD